MKMGNLDPFSKLDPLNPPTGIGESPEKVLPASQPLQPVETDTFASTITGLAHLMTEIEDNGEEANSVSS